MRKNSLDLKPEFLNQDNDEGPDFNHPPEKSDIEPIGVDSGAMTCLRGTS